MLAPEAIFRREKKRKRRKTQNSHKVCPELEIIFTENVLHMRLRFCCGRENIIDNLFEKRNLSEAAVTQSAWNLGANLEEL
jgi:hypothetical protein